MVIFGKIRFVKIAPLVISLLFITMQPAVGQVNETTELLQWDRSKDKVNTRFQPPLSYTWLKPASGSFAEYLVNFPLYPPGFPVRDFRAVPIENQAKHIAVLKIDVGNYDLQQCADAWMRLYAEYLWSKKRADEVGFQFTSGQYYSWMDYKKGVRTVQHNKSVKFAETGEFKEDYLAFRDYLNIIFRYAGTISLDQESFQISNIEDVQPGDFLIKPGSPGHSVIVVGVARNPQGKRLFLLAESYMPAQDVHILINPNNREISPWYELDLNAKETKTAKYTFKPTVMKRFHALK